MKKLLFGLMVGAAIGYMARPYIESNMGGPSASHMGRPYIDSTAESTGG